MTDPDVLTRPQVSGFFALVYFARVSLNPPISVPVVAPSVLVLTKIKRWSFLAESTRPLSIRKAKRDVEDIEVLLKWLARNGLRIDFEAYPEKPEQDLLSGVRMLYQMHPTVRPLLETTLKTEHFTFISN